MSYLIVVVLSLVLTYLGFMMQVTDRNIMHIRNGREPDAGASVFPVVPCGQLFFIGLVWGMDFLYPNLGLWICVIYCGAYTVYWCVAFPPLHREFRSLVKAKASTRQVTPPSAGEER